MSDPVISEETPEAIAAAKAAEEATAAAKAAEKKESFSKEYVEKLRREQAATATRLKELETKESEREAAALKANGEHEKIAQKAQKELEKERAERESDRAKARQRVAKRELKVELVQAGVLDPDDAALIDLSAVEYDDEDEPIGISALVENFKKLKPLKFKSAATEEETEAEKIKKRGIQPISPNGSDSKGKPKDAKTFSREEMDAAWARAGKA